MQHPRFSLLSNPTSTFNITRIGHLYEVDSVNFTGMQPVQLEGAKRNVILDFSRGSRRRLIKQIRAYGAIVPIFVTLGYNDPMPTMKEAKKHLHHFLGKLLRVHPTYWVVWRAEFQKAGRVHFHLLIYNQEKKPFVPKEWIQKHWSQCANRKCLYPRVEALRSHRGGLYYCAKYLAKDNDIGWSNYKELYPQSSPGRFWGIHGRKNFKETQVIETLSAEDFKYFLLTLLEEKAARSLTRDLIKQGWEYVKIDAFKSLDEWDQLVKDKAKEIFKKGGVPTWALSDENEFVQAEVERSKAKHDASDIDSTFIF